MPFRFLDQETGRGVLTLELERDEVESLLNLAARVPLARVTRGVPPERVQEASIEEVALACIGTTLYLAEQTDAGMKVLLQPRLGRARRLIFAWDRDMVVSAQLPGEERPRRGRRGRL